MGDMICILLKFLLNFGQICCLRYGNEYGSTSPKSHGISSQEAAGFKHTGVESERINKYMFVYIEV